jgi:tetratricopeptide (TPR) repeat protein
LGSLYGQAFLHMNLAAVALKQERWQPAIEELVRCQRLCAQIDAEDFTAEAYRYLAEAHLGRGLERGQEGQEQIAKALEYAQQSVHLAVKQEMKLEEGTTRRVLGRILLARGEHQAAEQELNRSLTMLEALDSQYQIGQTLVDLALLYRDLDRPREFHQSIERAIDILKRLGAKLDLERARQLI